MRSNDLRNNIDKIHTTELGKARIIKNTAINEDVVEWCKKTVLSNESVITKKGKNWYITNNNYQITINASSYTIITCHVL